MEGTVNLETDFDYADPGEKQSYSIDFVNDMRDGDTITGATWTCALISTESGSVPDPSPASRLTGSAVYNGTITSQFVQNLQPGNRYRLQAVVTTQLGEIISDYSHVHCRALA
jgi:hypothetical protein